MYPQMGPRATAVAFCLALWLGAGQAMAGDGCGNAERVPIDEGPACVRYYVIKWHNPETEAGSISEYIVYNFCDYHIKVKEEWHQWPDHSFVLASNERKRRRFNHVAGMHAVHYCTGNWWD